ncbi:ATP-binding cassette domain-containing protein [Lactiplantibacillus argentoratensis]|nr:MULTISPECIES: ATP-binding cassette domain-containing protein [Lactiplantibacillus]MBT1145104.1 ATP-binding cassette domain-containing protein [Lactiplantibacillus argentoratensis]MBT1147967.1 ATP-binding cassette domain-containing protein [Lactiplantibacillus argentoratensis]MBT1150778.1 ATP-binding cassette domain-containing protein [Lactiplantibacillus argentoratensis]MBT1153914.1 ATP-binding cassette domain-containing protein [Lactiplantibacillus argentoratensis]MCC9316145.1 ATP-binding 
MLSVKNLNKSFGRKQVLHQISFSCEPGRIAGLVGANGAGKTTIMKAVLSLTSATGEITIDGRRSTFDHHDALDEVGALIEYPSIYPFMTGRDHLKLFVIGKNKTSEIDDIVEALNMENYIDAKARSYSLGMKQKLGVAVAFLNNPKFVILDEPMNGLDPQATKELRELIITKRNEGVSFLISSHILSELQKLAEDLIIIDHGKIVQETTMDALLRSNNHFVILTTTNDVKAKKVLFDAGYKLVESDGVKIKTSSDDDVANILKTLSDSQVPVTDVQHEDEDLEGSVLKLLNLEDRK